jgi:sulfite reductase alpha subunit-like flavoprotein
VGILALGDRHYSAFCGFGHALEQQLHALGATPLFPLIEVDNTIAPPWPPGRRRWPAAAAVPSTPSACRKKHRMTRGI